MSRKNSPFDSERELNDLIAQYESAKADNKALYLDGDQCADIADKYATDHRFADAQEIISYGLELHPNNTALLIEQAYLYLDTDQMQQAKQVANSITEDYDLEVILLKAEILLSNGQLTEADELLNTIEGKDELDIIIDVAYLYIDMGYSENALPWLKLGMKKYHNDEAYLAATADCYRSSESQDERAIYFYNLLIDINPYNPIYWVGLAKCHFNLMEYEKCIEAADFALAADEHCGEAHSIKAHALFYLDNEDGAIIEYKAALECNNLPSEVNFIFMGLAYYNKEEWDKSIECFEMASAVIEKRATPSYFLPDIFHHLSACYQRKKEYDKATLLNQKAREMNPHSKEYVVQSGVILLETDHPEEARRVFDKIAQQDTEGFICEQIGLAYLERHSIDEAVLFLEKAYKLDPTLSEVNTQLSIIYLLKQDFKKFIQYNSHTENPLTYETLEQELKKHADELQEDAIQGLLQALKEEMEKKENNNNNTN